MDVHESKQKLKIPDRLQLHSMPTSMKTGLYSLQYIMFEHNVYLHTDITCSPDTAGGGCALPAKK